jgi:hypothetical protein
MRTVPAPDATSISKFVAPIFCHPVALCSKVRVAALSSSTVNEQLPEPASWNSPQPTLTVNCFAPTQSLSVASMWPAHSPWPDEVG